MAYQLGGALAGLYDPDDLEPLTTPYQKLRLGLEPPQGSPFYDLEHELAGRAAPVLYKNLSQDSDQGTRRVTDELVDQLLRARRARSINDPSGLDKLRSPDQVPQEPSFTERMLMDYLPRAGIFAADVSKPQIFHDYMTDAEKNWNEGNYGTAAAYLGLAPIGAVADVASTAILPASIEKSLGAGAARALSRAGRAADDALGGSRMAAGAGLAAGGAAMLPDDAEAGAPKWYSALERAIENAPQGKATIDQWMGHLTNRPGVKKEELEYTFGSKAKDGGILDLDIGKQPVTKQQLLEELDKNRVGVDEVFYGNPLTRDERDRLRGFDLEENPFNEEFKQHTPDEIKEHLRLINTRNGSRLPKYPDEYSLPGDATNYREIAVTSPRAEWDPNISEGHFGPGGHMRPEPDWQDKKAGQQIGWIRGDVRKLDDGSRAFHVDEFQSDPAQRANKLGWKNSEVDRQLKKQKELMKERSELLNSTEHRENYDILDGYFGEHQWSDEDAAKLVMSEPQTINGHAAREYLWNTNRARELINEADAIPTRFEDKLINEQGVPDRPWKKDWPKLLFRRALWEAVQEDADHLTWTPAEIQQKRWGRAQLGRDRLYEETIPKIAAEEAKRLGLPKEAVGEVKGGSGKASEAEFDDLSYQISLIDTNFNSAQDRRDELDLLMQKNNLSLEARKKALGIDPRSDDWVSDVEKLLTDELLKRDGGPQRLFSLKLTPEIRKKILAEGLPTFVGAGVAPGLVERFLSEE